jgi:membrane peptidoglycan carboxypeptidase
LGRYGRGRTIILLTAIALGAGLLSAATALPILGAAGVAARDAARTFNDLPVAGLGQLPARSAIVDAHGHLIAYYYPRNKYRVPVSYQQIAPVMRDAIIAIEDSRFYQRSGPARDDTGADHHPVRCRDPGRIRHRTAVRQERLHPDRAE